MKSKGLLSKVSAPLTLKTMAKNPKIEKTNAARLLDRAKIEYELIPYTVDEENLAATHVAEELGEDIATVFKTLILKGDRAGHFVCVIPGDKEVDLKAAARVSGNKKCDLIPMKELLPLTGYIRGGCTPIGMKKHFPTYIHETCMDFPFIFVSAGVRGLQIKLAPQDLINQSKATICCLFNE
jgi:Cys-tRNA(Pro)/Cys-tRNA(Cys) deacylase